MLGAWAHDSTGEAPLGGGSVSQAHEATGEADGETTGDDPGTNGGTLTRCDPSASSPRSRT
jgi:hypothetical protein